MRSEMRRRFYFKIFILFVQKREVLLEEAVGMFFLKWPGRADIEEIFPLKKETKPYVGYCVTLHKEKQ